MTEAAADDGALRVLVRPAREGDQGYVMSTWALYLCSLGDRCSKPRGMHFQNERLTACQASRSLVDRVSEHPAVRIAIASELADSDRILGWLAYTDSGAARIVHGVYVRDRVRHRHVARSLAEGVGIADARPLLYTLPGPFAKSLLARPQFQNAVHLSIEEFLS